MKQVVYKYKLDPKEQIISLPLGAQVLTAQVQFEEVQLWALVDPDTNIHEDREFWVIGTGWKIEVNEGKRLQYISTFQLSGGSLIFHVFELVSDTNP